MGDTNCIIACMQGFLESLLRGGGECSTLKLASPPQKIARSARTTAPPPDHSQPPTPEKNTPQNPPGNHAM